MPIVLANLAGIPASWKHSKICQPDRQCRSMPRTRRVSDGYCIFFHNYRLCMMPKWGCRSPDGADCFLYLQFQSVPLGTCMLVQDARKICKLSLGEQTLSSSSVKPRPALFFILYLTVCPLTTGLSAPATGLGKTAAALAFRAAHQWFINNLLSVCCLHSGRICPAILLLSIGIE